MNAADLALKALAEKAHGTGQWFGPDPLSAIHSDYSLACSPERILSLLARLERMEQALKRGIGAIEACAMQGRGIPVNWDAINATQDEMRAALEGATEPQP